MKQWLKTMLCCLMLLALCGCGSNFSKIDLQKPVEISDTGIVAEGTWKQIKEEQAIAVFQGTSNGCSYEWTIFGSDLSSCRDVNLKVEIENSGDESVRITFAEQNPFEFSALLSIHLNEKWNAPSASVYQNETPVSTVSITGTKETILNISVKDLLGTCEILPDVFLSDAVETDMPDISTEKTDQANDSTETTAYTKSVETAETNYLSEMKISEEPGKLYASETKAARPEKEREAGESSGRPEYVEENYLSAVQNATGRVYSDGSGTEKDKYQTDPIPAGKPLPVEPEDQKINKKIAYTCTFSIECSTILNNLADLDPDKLEMVPSNGTILKATTAEFYEGESVYDVLQRICEENGIHMEASWTPIYNSAYVEGIHNLYEFDCGSLSGWMYKVNGWYPNYGCSRYQLEDEDVVEWRYTYDLGNDIGGGYAVGG